LPEFGPASGVPWPKLVFPAVPLSMTKPWVLDTGPLGRLTHPARNPAIASWLERELTRGLLIIIPEIADYELRRSLLLEGLTQSLERLDELKAALVYLPITTSVMLRAAELWAEA